MPRAKAEKTALMQATDLLARQEQSEQKLRTKLLHRGYAEEETEAAIEELKARHYLNDAEACARQFRFLYEESRSSVRQICAKLQQRGFDSSLVRECIPSDTYEREKAAALKCLHLKFRPSVEKKKMFQHLYLRGFESSAIQSAVEEFRSSEDEGD